MDAMEIVLHNVCVCCSIKKIKPQLYSYMCGVRPYLRVTYNSLCPSPRQEVSIPELGGRSIGS